MEGGHYPVLFDRVGCVDCPEAPLVLAVGDFVVEGDSVGGGLEGCSHIADPAVPAGFETGFDALLAKVLAALDAGVEVVCGSVPFLEAVVNMEFPGIALEAKVVCVGLDGEPYFDLIGVFVDLGLLVELEGVLEGESGGV